MKRWLVRLICAGLLVGVSVYSAAFIWIFSHRSTILYGVLPGPTPFPKQFDGKSVRLGAGRDALTVWEIPAIGRAGSAGVGESAGIAAVSRSKFTVLYLHGTDTNLSGSTAILSLWHARGYRVVALDYRGYGESPGSPSALGFVRDAERVLRWIIEGGVEPENIVVHGHSMGASVAMQLGVREPRLRGIISDAGFSTAERVVRDTWSRWIPTRLFVGDDHEVFNTAKAVPKVMAPVLIAHGNDDTIVPVSHGKRLAALVRCGDSLLIEGEGHESLFRNQVDVIVKRFEQAVATCERTRPATLGKPKSR